MAELDWVERQNQAAQNLLKQGSEALREGKLDLARMALTESAIVLDMAHEESNLVRKLRAQAFNELGVVHQRGNDTATARTFHHQAAALCREIVEEGDKAFRGNSAATHLNLANLNAVLGDMDQARDALLISQQTVDELLGEGEETVRTMASAIYLTKASMHASREEYEEADAAMTQGVELARQLIEQGNQALYVQTVQGCQQLSVQLFQNDQFDLALKWGRVAEELSEEAFETLGQEVVSMYIVSQVNLISYNEKLFKFADAEDSFGKAIDLVGNDPRLLKRGLEFYELCRKQSNARLEAGDLPRDEVEEGYADVLARIEEIGGLPEEPEVKPKTERAPQQLATTTPSGAQGSEEE